MGRRAPSSDGCNIAPDVAQPLAPPLLRSSSTSVAAPGSAAPPPFRLRREDSAAPVLFRPRVHRCGGRQPCGLVATWPADSTAPLAIGGCVRSTSLRRSLPHPPMASSARRHSELTPRLATLTLRFAAADGISAEYGSEAICSSEQHSVAMRRKHCFACLSEYLPGERVCSPPGTGGRKPVRSAMTAGPCPLTTSLRHRRSVGLPPGTGAGTVRGVPLFHSGRGAGRFCPSPLGVPGGRGTSAAHCPPSPRVAVDIPQPHAGRGAVAAGRRLRRLRAGASPRPTRAASQPRGPAPCGGRRGGASPRFAGCGSAAPHFPATSHPAPTHAG